MKLFDFKSLEQLSCLSQLVPGSLESIIVVLDKRTINFCTKEKVVLNTYLPIHDFMVEFKK